MSDELAFVRVVEKWVPGGRLHRAWPLTGGVSALVMALEVVLPDGGSSRMVLRRHGDVDFNQNPHVAADEFRLLKHLYAAGVPVPEPYYLDETEDILGRPYLIVAFVEGEPWFAPVDLDDYIRQMAGALAQIHRLRVPFLPEQQPAVLPPLNETATETEKRIHEVLQPLWPLPQTQQPVLLHGDYWPGNLLWRDARLVAVIDWEDAASGDPLVDLANARLEVLWAFGMKAVHEFTRQYQTEMPGVDFTHLPYRDLYTALRQLNKIGGWTDDAAELARLQDGIRQFVRQAQENLHR